MQNVIISEKESNLSQFYQENGYVVVKDAISKNTLTRLQGDLIALFSKHYSEIKDPLSLDAKILEINAIDTSKLYRLQISATKLASFYLLLAEIHDYLIRISPPSCDLFFMGLGYVLGVPQSQRLAYDWHQDGTYHEGERKKSIHVWFPIFYPVTIENGAMSILEKSHELGLLDYKKTKFQGDGYTTNKVVDLENSIGEYKELVCAMNVGDCMFFCDELIHKSNINQTQQCRIAGVIKYSLNASYDIHSGLVGV